MKTKNNKISRKFFIKNLKDDFVKLFFDKFIRPVLNNLTVTDEESKFTKAINLFFNIETRKLDWYRANKSFLIPCKSDRRLTTIDDRKKRFLRKDQLILIRSDVTMPDRVEVAVNDSDGNETVFILKEFQFNFMRDLIRELE